MLLLPKESSSWTRGQRLLRVILAKGWTLDALAKAAGVGRTTLYRMTSDEGAATLRSWERVADALGMGVSELLGMVG